MVKQMSLPGFVIHRAFKITSNFIRLKSMDMEEGLEYLKKQPNRKINGQWIENVAAASATRLKMFSIGRIQCVECGIRGDHFHIERHKNDKVMPFSVNLYGWKGDREVLMTWDHILPKSLGGSNRIENAQCMCTDCNSKKGNKLSIFEIIDIVSSEHAIEMYRNTPTPNTPIRNTIHSVHTEFQNLYKGLENAA